MAKHFLTGMITPLMVFALSGCVAIPDQPEIVSQVANAEVNIMSGNCKVAPPDRTQQFVSHIDGSTSTLDPDGFSVLNWNIYKGNRDNWQDDFMRFSARQDIVLLQEALLTDALKSTLNEQGLNWNLNTAFYLADQQTGVMTAAKVASAYHCALRSIEPIIRVPKTALISRYALAGMPDQLMVANIHGINFTLGLDAYGEQLSALEEILLQHNGPILLAGDFNNWSDDRTKLLLEMAQRLSLQQLPYENHNRTMVFGSAIDHIFYRGLSVLSHTTHQVTSSDHNPITVTFKATQTRIARNP